jgi:hypothetical protein
VGAESSRVEGACLGLGSKNDPILIDSGAQEPEVHDSSIRMGKRHAGGTDDGDAGSDAGCMNELVVLNASDIPQNVRSSPYPSYARSTIHMNDQHTRLDRCAATCGPPLASPHSLGPSQLSMVSRCWTYSGALRRIPLKNGYRARSISVKHVRRRNSRESRQNPRRNTSWQRLTWRFLPPRLFSGTVSGGWSRGCRLRGRVPGRDFLLR